MRVLAHCPRCLAAARFDTAAAPPELVCPKCGDARPVTLSEAVRERGEVDRCAMCGCGHLYIEKDFNGVAGFGIIVTAIVASGIAWAYDVFIAVGILAGAALLDLGVWAVSPERTVCYRCAASYRGAAVNPAHGRYELGIAGRFADDYDEQRRRHQG